MVLNKKALKLVVCMSLIIALAISALSLSAGATYENTHYNTGDQSQDIVNIAKTQVGYYEGYDGYTKYGDWYGLPNSDWCAMFVSWCANQAGVDTNTFPSFALCSAGCDWFMSQGNFHYSGSYTPKAGDLIFYASYGNIYHVGLVTGSDGYNVYSIEGNYNEAVSNVCYSLSYGDILGYATPNYKISSDVDSDYSVTTDSEDIYYEENTDSETTTAAGDTTTAADSNTAGGEKLTLKVLTHRTDRIEDGTLDAMTDAFEEANNCIVEYQGFTDYSTDIPTMMNTTEYIAGMSPICFCLVCAE